MKGQRLGYFSWEPPTLCVGPREVPTKRKCIKSLHGCAKLGFRDKDKVENSLVQDYWLWTKKNNAN